MTINRQIKDGAVGARKRASAVRERTYQFEPCNMNIPTLGALNAALATGLAATTFTTYFPGGSVLGTYTGINTVLGPWFANGQGLAVALTGTDNIGGGYVFSDGYNATSRHTMTVADESAIGNPMFFRIKFKITTVAGTDECVVGFRKAETHQADYEAYDEMAAFNIDAGNVFVETILNGAATTKVDTGTNWLDGEEHEIKLIVGATLGQGGGYVQFFYDGDQIGVNPFTFDDAEVIVPFFQVIQAAGLTEVYWTEFEIGEVKNVEKAI